MKGIRSRAGRLDPVSYENLRQRVLHRDGWRCQSCGTMSNLEVHHQKFRSHAGNDSEQNLITLCSTCYKALEKSSSVHRIQIRGAAEGR